ncbi:hypothetical protein ES707_12520 [subsurface metagenome]
MLTPRSLYSHLERIKGRIAADQEEKIKVEAQLSKQIPLNRRDSNRRRYGITSGIKRLEIAKNGISYPDLICAIMALIPKTRHKKVDQLRVKASKPFKYSTYTRVE